MMEMEFIASKFIPDHHPIERYNAKHRSEYIRGLGELLCFFMPENTKAKLALEILCKKLSDATIDDVWRCNIATKNQSHKAKDIDDNSNDNHHDLKQIDFASLELNSFKQATSLKREGFKFFRMVDSFWWDFYHICQMVKYPIENELNTLILDHIIRKSSRKYNCEAKNWFYANGEGKHLPSDLKQVVFEDNKFKKNGFTRVLVVGTMSSGKSTLINALVGQKVAKVKTTVCTSSVSYFCNRPSSASDIILYADSNTYLIANNFEKTFNKYSMVSFNFSGGLQEEPIIFIDTPGVNYAYDKRHRALTEREIASKNYDIILCVVNSAYMESEESEDLLNTIAKVRDKKIIFVLNQLDLYSPDDDSIEDCINHFKSAMKKLKMRAEVVPFSAKAALLFKKYNNGITLTKTETTEMLVYKKIMAHPYYDLASYYYGKASKGNDFNARTGLTCLESAIVKQSKN